MLVLVCVIVSVHCIFFFKPKTAYEMRISDWSSDVCSSDLAVIDGVWRALKPGGRFVAEMGGAGNVGRIVAALVAALDRRGLDGAAAVPWYFPDVAEYRARLAARGFAIGTIELFARPTP